MTAFLQNLSPMNTASSGAFCDAAKVVRSWYVVMPSRKLRREKAVAVEMLNRRLAVWRDRGGAVHAVDAQCPHLGADLSLGTVVESNLRCPFHHWQFDRSGACVGAPCESRLPQRKTRAYRVCEKHGLIWLYNGDAPAFELPEFGDEEAGRYRRIRVPPLHLNCHPHLAIANGLDATHLDKLHGLDFTAEPTLEKVDAHSLRLCIRGRPRCKWVQLLTGARRDDVQAIFTTYGCSIACLTFTHPLRFHAVFTARPDATGQTDTQTLVFLPRGFGLKAVRCACTLLSVLHADRAILNTIRFQPGFVESDRAMIAFAKLINAMEVDV